MKLAVAATALLCLAGGALAQEVGAGGASQLPPTVRDGKIAFVLTSRVWAIYDTADGKKECPAGFNDGPREQYSKLFPNDGKKRTLAETRLIREGRQWHPETSTETFKFSYAGGDTSYGANLDGKMDANDFTSPDGTKGVDNELYRALGCILEFRDDQGRARTDELVTRYNYNRLIVEISDVDSLENDDEVIVHTYRGLDELLPDAMTKSYLAGGTQNVDERWGRVAEYTLYGKIVDGVLITDPANMKLVWSGSFGTTGFELLKDYSFRLKLTGDKAEGLMVGYLDIDGFIHRLNSTASTGIQTYGKLSTPSLYHALKRLADAYPDPETGEMTAISSALAVKLVQTYVSHPGKCRHVASSEGDVSSKHASTAAAK